jgi:hypothetical protein
MAGVRAPSAVRGPPSSAASTLSAARALTVACSRSAPARPSPRPVPVARGLELGRRASGAQPELGWRGRGDPVRRSPATGAARPLSAPCGVARLCGLLAAAPDAACLQPARDGLARPTWPSARPWRSARGAAPARCGAPPGDVVEVPDLSASRDNSDLAEDDPCDPTTTSKVYMNGWLCHLD